MNKLFKIIDFLTWGMLIITFFVSVFTLIVLFGMTWRPWFIYFINFKILEICLAITLFLWGLTSIRLHDKKAKTHGVCSFVFAGIFLFFLMFQVY